MSFSIKQGFYCALAALLVALAALHAHADSAGLGLNPGRAEVEVMPGDATIRDLKGNVVAELKHYEATVLLASATNEEPITITDLPAGHYEIEAHVDFQDGHPIQVRN